MGKLEPLTARSRTEFVQSLIAAVVMSLLVTAVYFPVRLTPTDNTLVSLDFHQLHARRIQFAQEAILSGRGVPAWYPRELMGTPFRANVQNFPFIPTRLAVLWLDPLDIPAAGATLSAVLSALFTFALARTLGMTRVGAAVAGWTFACAGFYAARVMVGHLPLLEAYPALPLLLWRVEVALSSRSETTSRTERARALGILALATLCVVLAGHPQIPLYAIVVATLHLAYRGRQRLRQSVLAFAAMTLGGMCGAFSLWPMLQLIGRSTRVLALDDATNDTPFPYRRLLAFILPWHDGWPEGHLGVTGRAFTGYPNQTYFWETVCYVGLAPLAAGLFLLIRCVMLGRRGNGWLPTEPWRFFAVVGVLALMTALPIAQAVVEKIPGTYLRSASRQVYVTTFALALATGLAADVLSRRARENTRRRVAWGGFLAVGLIAHGLDLGIHDRSFIRMTTMNRERNAPFEQTIRDDVGDGRVAIDYALTIPLNREIDDVGFFDSIMLARPYAALLGISGKAPGRNVQFFNGSQMSPRALAMTGTRLVMTTDTRSDLQLLSGDSPLRVYAVANSLPRAALFSASSITSLSEPDMQSRLRDPGYDIGRSVMLMPSDGAKFATHLASATPTTQPTMISHERPNGETIDLQVRTSEASVLRLLDTWDPGWQATIDGSPAEVMCADTTFLAVPIPPGEHDVHLTYDTPGATTGMVISLISASLLAALLAWTIRNHRTPSNTSAVS